MTWRQHGPGWSSAQNGKHNRQEGQEWLPAGPPAHGTEVAGRCGERTHFDGRFAALGIFLLGPYGTCAQRDWPRCPFTWTE